MNIGLYRIIKPEFHYLLDPKTPERVVKYLHGEEWMKFFEIIWFYHAENRKHPMVDGVINMLKGLKHKSPLKFEKYIILIKKIGPEAIDQAIKLQGFIYGLNCDNISTLLLHAVLINFFQRIPSYLICDQINPLMILLDRGDTRIPIEYFQNNYFPEFPEFSPKSEQIVLTNIVKKSYPIRSKIEDFLESLYKGKDYNYSKLVIFSSWSKCLDYRDPSSLFIGPLFYKDLEKIYFNDDDFQRRMILDDQTDPYQSMQRENLVRYFRHQYQSIVDFHFKQLDQDSLLSLVISLVLSDIIL